MVFKPIRHIRSVTICHILLRKICRQRAFQILFHIQQDELFSLRLSIRMVYRLHPDIQLFHIDIIVHVIIPVEHLDPSLGQFRNDISVPVGSIAVSIPLCDQGIRHFLQLRCQILSQQSRISAESGEPEGRDHGNRDQIAPERAAKIFFLCRHSLQGKPEDGKCIYDDRKRIAVFVKHIGKEIQKKIDDHHRNRRFRNDPLALFSLLDITEITDIVDADPSQDEHSGGIFDHRHRKQRLIRITVFVYDPHQQLFQSCKRKAPKPDIIPSVKQIMLRQQDAVCSVSEAAADEHKPCARVTKMPFLIASDERKQQKRKVGDDDLSGTSHSGKKRQYHQENGSDLFLPRLFFLHPKT